MWWRKIIHTPDRRQIDPIECGAICLGIILEAHGRYVDSKTLRNDCNVSRNGADAQSLIDAAHRYGLVTKARKIPFSAINTVATPAIIFVDQCHFVVLEGHRGRLYYVNDPGRGHYVLTAAEFKKRYSDVVIEAWPSEKFIRDEIHVEQKAFAPRLLAHGLGMLAALFVVVLASFTSVVTSLPPTIRQDLMVTFIALACALLLGLAASFYGWLVLVHHHGQRIALKHGEELFHGLITVAPNFFADRPFAIFERVVLQGIKHAHAHAHGSLAKIFWLPFFAIALMRIFFIAPIVAACVACGLVLVAWASVRRQNQFTADTSSLATPPLLSLTLNAMGQRDRLIDNLIDAHGPYKQSSIVPWRNAALPLVVIVLVLMAINGVSLPLWRVQEFSLWRSIEIILLGYVIFFAAGQMKRAKPLVDERRSLVRELDASSHVARLGDEETLVRAHAVSFRYPGESLDVLTDINLAIGKNMMLGVVGSSQAGVSTFMKLIAGIYAPTDGELSRARAKIVLINDESDLAAGVLRDVLTLNDQKKRDEEIVRALTIACATDLFYHRPMGLLSPIFDRGSNLSSSERSRLLLAQALMHEPDMVVLDDFFITIESRLAEEILVNLKRQKITTLVSSFDGALLAKTDSVVFLHHHTIHKIAEHAQLYFADENYRDVVRQSAVEASPL